MWQMMSFCLSPKKIECSDNLSVTPWGPVLWGGLVCLRPMLHCFTLGFCLPSGLLLVTGGGRCLIRPSIWLCWEALDIFPYKNLRSVLVFLLSLLSPFRLLSAFRLLSSSAPLSLSSFHSPWVTPASLLPSLTMGDRGHLTWLPW